MEIVFIDSCSAPLEACANRGELARAVLWHARMVAIGVELNVHASVQRDSFRKTLRPSFAAQLKNLTSRGCLNARVSDTLPKKPNGTLLIF
eukprot:4536348-Amphidinium_carterae.1